MLCYASVSRKTTKRYHNMTCLFFFSYDVISDHKKRIRKTFYGKISSLFFCINPLTTNVKYTRHDTVVTSNSCNSGHSENYESFLTFSCKSLKFPTKWYTKLCNLVDPFLRNCVTKSNFQYLKKNWPKKAPVLKGLNVF